MKSKNNNPIFSKVEECEKYAKQIELYAYNKAAKNKNPELYTTTVTTLKPVYYFVCLIISLFVYYLTSN